MTQKINVWIIYVLELEDSCWYIGQTTSIAFKQRMKNHWDHPTKGAMWTRRHKPLKIFSIDTYDRSLTGSEIDRIEDKRTLEIAAQYGFESTRGGVYCQLYPTWPIIAKKEKLKKRLPKQERAIADAKRQLALSAKRIG